MQARVQKIAFFSAKLLLSVGVIFYIVRGLNLDQLRTNLLAVEPSMFALALALIGAQTLLLNGRWMMIMRSLDIMIDWVSGLRILLISFWFNQVLPSSAGGDAVRIWLLRRRGVQWSPAVKGVVADRFTALLGIVALMVAGFPILLNRVNNPAALLAIGALAAAGAFGTLFLLTLDRWPPRMTAFRLVAPFVRFGISHPVLVAAIPAAGDSVWIRDSDSSDDGRGLLRAGGRLAGASICHRCVHSDSTGRFVDRRSDLDQRMGSSRRRHGGMPRAGGCEFDEGAGHLPAVGSHQRDHWLGRRHRVGRQSRARTIRCRCGRRCRDWRTVGNAG